MTLLRTIVLGVAATAAIATTNTEPVPAVRTVAATAFSVVPLLDTTVEQTGTSVSVTFRWAFIFDAGSTVEVRHIAGITPPSDTTGTVDYTGTDGTTVVTGLTSKSDWSFRFTGPVNGVQTTVTKRIVRAKITILSQRWDGNYVRIKGRVTSVLGGAAGVTVHWSCRTAAGRVNTATYAVATATGRFAAYTNQSTPGKCTFTAGASESFYAEKPSLMRATTVKVAKVPYLIGTNGIDNIVLLNNRISTWTSYQVMNAGKGVKVLLQRKVGSSWTTVSTLHTGAGGRLTFTWVTHGSIGAIVTFRLLAPAHGPYLSGSVLISRTIVG